MRTCWFELVELVELVESVESVVFRSVVSCLLVVRLIV